jgi:hypothetical protein
MTNDQPPSALETDDQLDDQILAQHRSIPQAVREQALRRDDHRCRIDGRRSPVADGSARLVVQRLVDEPAAQTPNALTNVTTYCLPCARLIAQMPTRDDLPPVLQTRVDGADLDADRIGILKYLHRTGPVQTGELVDHVELAGTTSVRRALYDLMSRDVRDDAVDGRLVAKDRLAETYGLPWQIPDERDARGVIPLRPHTRRTRILDAVVARLLDALEGRVDEPREVAAAVVDRNPDQTYHMQRRAEAFGFPFEEWAGASRSRDGAAAAVEAVSILATATDTVSRKRLAEPLVDVLERNDGHELATVLRQALLEDDDRGFDSLADRSDQPDQPGPAAEPAAAPSLQVFGENADADADEPHPADEPRGGHDR